MHIHMWNNKLRSHLYKFAIWCLNEIVFCRQLQLGRLDWLILKFLFLFSMETSELISFSIIFSWAYGCDGISFIFSIICNKKIKKKQMGAYTEGWFTSPTLCCSSLNFLMAGLVQASLPSWQVALSCWSQEWCRYTVVIILWVFIFITLQRAGSTFMKCAISLFSIKDWIDKIWM